eukprot:Gb_13968 [translate_table: standard]
MAAVSTQDPHVMGPVPYNSFLESKPFVSVPAKMYIVGGHFDQCETLQGGNVFTVPSNRKAEFNMYLDPLAAKQVMASKLNITLIPLNTQHKVSSFPRLLKEIKKAKQTPEAVFVYRLLSRMSNLHRSHHAYSHIDMFLGEVLGAAVMVNQTQLKSVTMCKPLSVLASGEVDSDGSIVIDHRNGNPLCIVEDIDSFAYYNHVSATLNRNNQSAVIASFSAQKRLWNTPAGISPPPF